MNEPQFVRESVTVRVPCEHCGGVASMELTPEQSQRFRRVLEAAEKGLEPVEVEVSGEG